MLRNQPIRKKLTAIIMLTCMAGLIIAGTAFILQDRHNVRRDTAQELSVLAKVIGDRSTAALIFDDKKQAEENLAALTVKKSIENACIKRPNTNECFACYSSSDTQCGENCWPFPVSQQAFQQFYRNALFVSQPIFLEDKIIGSIHIRFSLQELAGRLQLQVLIALIIVALAGLCALLVSNRLQRIISEPLTKLAKTVKVITDNNDYSIRADIEKSKDETGHLVDAFNNMLSQIEQRDHDLRQSRKRFRTLVDQAGDAFFLLDTDGKIVDINRQANETLGYSEEELLLMTWDDIDTESEDHHKNIFDEESKTGRLITFECIHTRKDGSSFPVEVRLGQLEMGDDKYFLGLARDISDRKLAEQEKERLEARLSQSQKMEAIGTLAGGIAHDFNNILTGVIGFTEMVLSGDSSGEQAKDDLKEVLKAGYRARDLVRQILTFSRKNEQNFCPVQIQLLIKETIKMLRAIIPTTIDIQQHIDMQTGCIMSDPTQIHQLVLNLCTNAAQAMENNTGTLKIHLEEVCLHGSSLHGNPNEPVRRYARLAVSDTGEGVDEATMERIFEPYFTTKEVGKGSGMGLAMVHGIVENLKGKINVSSQAGIGTTFEVFLPISEHPKIEDETETPQPISNGKGRILLVDDEEPIVVLGKRFLEGLGYKVTALTSSLDALQTFQHNPKAFDLVITDQAMPYLPGSDLARELLQIRDDLPIILCTGFSSTISEQKAKAIGIRAFIMKPLNRDEFARVVCQVMNDS